MRNHRITDDQAEAVLRGRTPHARDELSPFAAAVAGFRDSSLGTSPRPSAAVASRLDLDRVSTVGLIPRENPDMTSPTPHPAASTRRRRVAVEWLAGLGLAAKIAIGATAAAAAGVAGAGAAGAAGVLPTPAQAVFEQVTGTHPGDEHVSETGAETGAEHSESGRQTAEDALRKGAEQHQSGLETAEENAGNGIEVAEEHADEHAEAGLENAADNAGAGVGTAGEAGAGAGEGAGDAADDAGSVADEKAGKDVAGD
jgi:hypothetical protein